MKALNACKEAGLYALLIAIGIIFSAPLLWMIITSVKVDREAMDRDKMLPAIPVPEDVSPYLTDEKSEGDVSPEEQARWESHFREWYGEAAPEAIRGAVSREAALAAGGRAELPQEQVEFILGRAWGRVVREFMVAEPVLRSRERRTFLYENPEGWVAGEGPGVEVVEPYRPEEESARLIRTNFDEAGNSLSLEFLLEMDAGDVDDVDEIVLPVIADDSWHRLYLSVQTADGAWKSRAPYYLLLGTGGWSDLSWRKPDFEASRFSYEMFEPLRPLDATAEGLEAGQVLLTLHVERSGVLGAAWGKATRNYRTVFAAMPFARYMGNSLIIVLLNVVSALISCSLAGYAFARLRWRGREIYFIIMLGTMTLPPQVTMVPTFIIMKHLGFYNTYVPLFLPSLIATPFFVFLLRQFLKNVPRDLEDAALIDGCTHFRIYRSIMLPLIRPTLVIVVIFSFIAAWNEFLGPLIYLSDQNLYPVSLGIFAFQSYTAEIRMGSPAVMMAASTLMVLPVIALFFFAQRYFTQGIKMTGLK